MLNTDKNGLPPSARRSATRPAPCVSWRGRSGVGGDIENPDDLAGNASYFIQAKQAQNGPASFSGFICTDKGEPLPGVRLSIGRTSLSSSATRHDRRVRSRRRAAGPHRSLRRRSHQQITSARSGRACISRATWCAVRRTRLPHPIYLPPLLMTEAKVVGGNEDVDLTIPGLAGFRRVKANSVTFPRWLAHRHAGGEPW